MARKIEELSKERDFINHLLDIAQVIVITQNAQGEILMLNAHGEMLIQYTEKELQRKTLHRASWLSMEIYMN